MLVLLGEVGGADEYDVCDALKSGRITKPVVAWCIGTCASIFPFEVTPHLLAGLKNNRSLCIELPALVFCSGSYLHVMARRLSRLRCCCASYRRQASHLTNDTIHPPLYDPFVVVNDRCNSVTLELARAARVRPPQTRTPPSLRLVLLSPSRSTSSRPRSKKSSRGENVTLLVLDLL